MKALYSFILLTGLLLLSTGNLSAQCSNDNTQFGLSTITCGEPPTILTSCIYGGEYRVVNVTMGNTYTFSTCGDTDFDTQITLFNDAGGAYLAYNDDGCGAQSTVTWTATFTGAVRVLVDQYNCISNTTCMTLNASCTGQGGGGGGCTTASYGLYPSSTYTPTCNGSPGTITSLGYAGEYSNVNVTSGTSYTFSSSIGSDYITIAGSTGTPVYASGTTPVTWASTISGTVRFYTHTNSSCGESTSSRSRVVTCGSNPYDPCASITTLTCGESTTASSTGSGAWGLTVCGFSTPGQEKVYSFTATTSGFHTLVVTSTNSSYADYFFKAASGGCNSSGWSCIDDVLSAQSVTFGPLTAGTTYYILYVPESTGTVTQTFRIDCPALPCNSPGTPSASNVSTTGATLSWAAAGGATSYDYSYGTAGHVCGTGAVNTAATSVNLSGLTPNTTYTFCVRTSACGGGGATSYVSTTFTTAPLPNDACAGAITVTCGSTTNGSTVGAASDAGVGSCGIGSGGTPGNGVWYKLVGNGAQVTASLCGSAYDTKLHVYTGSCAGLTCLVSNDDAACGDRSQVVFNANVGTNYYILVNGFGSATGAFSLNLTCLCGPDLGAPWTVTNIGNSNGGAIENVCDGTIDVSATGFSTSASDVQTYAWQQLCGNGFIKAKVENVLNGGWGGIMFRENNAAGSKKVAMSTQLNSMITRELRATTNGATQQQQILRPTAMWLRITRTGNVFLGETSSNGVNWQFAFSVTLVLPNCVEVGLFAQSINVNTTTTAVFSNVMGVPTSPPVIPLVDANHGDVTATQEVLSLFPNPATDEINVKMEAFYGKNVTISVQNQLGQVMLLREIDEVQDATERIELTNLPSGIYTLTLRTAGQAPLSKQFMAGSQRP